MVKFETLWKNFPDKAVVKNLCQNKQPAKSTPFDNYCAILLSECFIKSGIDLTLLKGDRCCVDVGCGAGRDALFLVDRGFTVYAFDKSEIAIAKLNELGRAYLNEKLFLQICSFENFGYPRSSLISSCSSLFFCNPRSFAQAWKNISMALLPGGMFCGHFMGPEDSWAKLGRGDLTIHTWNDIEELFDSSYKIIDVYEHNSEGMTLVGRKKHWHTYSVVARKVK